MPLFLQKGQLGVLTILFDIDYKMNADRLNNNKIYKKIITDVLSNYFYTEIGVEIIVDMDSSIKTDDVNDKLSDIEDKLTLYDILIN